MKTLKPSEIAAYCDVHQRTVSRWIAKGELKGHKGLPGRWNYPGQLADFLIFSTEISNAYAGWIAATHCTYSAGD